MEQTQRIRKTINWLIFQEVAENERALANLMGYTKSSFSQLVNGKVPLSEKFVKKLCSLDPNINEVWIMTGEGNLLNSDNPNGLTDVTIPADVWAVIKAQANGLSARDRQIDDLIGLLQEQTTLIKKTLAPRDDNATSAAVG
jgi:hypothetical protein